MEGTKRGRGGVSYVLLTTLLPGVGIGGLRAGDDLLWPTTAGVRGEADPNGVRYELFAPTSPIIPPTTDGAAGGPPAAPYS